MIETILGIIATLITGFGYGTLYFFTFMFWYCVFLAYLKYKYGYNFVIDISKDEDVKDDKEEKTTK